MYNYIATIIVGTLLEGALTVWFKATITPKTIYESSKLTWIGCWFYFILLGLFSPVVFVIKTLNWLFRMGREE